MSLMIRNALVTLSGDQVRFMLKNGSQICLFKLLVEAQARRTLPKIIDHDAKLARVASS